MREAASVSYPLWIGPSATGPEAAPGRSSPQRLSPSAPEESRKWVLWGTAVDHAAIKPELPLRKLRN